MDFCSYIDNGNIFNPCHVFDFCQAQFQFSTSQVELSLALSLIITIHPPTPGKVEIQLEIGHIYGQYVAGK